MTTASSRQPGSNGSVRPCPRAVEQGRTDDFGFSLANLTTVSRQFLVCRSEDSLGIAEQHQRVIEGVQLVFDSCKAPSGFSSCSGTAICPTGYAFASGIVARITLASSPSSLSIVQRPFPRSKLRVPSLLAAF